MISAVVAVFIVLGTWNFFRVQGLTVVTLFVIIGACYEFSKIAFGKDNLPKTLPWFYLLLCCLWLTFAVISPLFHEVVLAIAFGTFVAVLFWQLRSGSSNEQILLLVGEGAIGMLYCLLLPSYAIATLKADQGPQWFCYLLLVVFFGDTFAYFGGSYFGKNKLLPQISPKKTLEGAFAGLLGSMLVSLVYGHIYEPLMTTSGALALGLFAGVLGQTGDLLASLIKRVAAVKDSGQIMPGHGGFLDRIDGVFLACPLIYFAATLKLFR